MRIPCFNCVRKHLAQALVLMCETEKGYPTHGWIAVGHLAEAEDEAIRLDPEHQITDIIRETRLQYMNYLEDRHVGFTGDITQLIQYVTELKMAQAEPKEADATPTDPSIS